MARLGYKPKPARAAIANALAWLLSSTQLPRWVRETLRPLPEVRSSRALIPRPL
jgi:dihydroflavonol-4-reductase